ncbi:MAG: DHHA1 domain-containing protein [Infirmifilum sp.]
MGFREAGLREMSDFLILAHGDTDGVTSAAIARSVVHGRVVFTHPVGILGDLDEFRGEAESVIILDISLDERLWRELALRLHEFKEAIYIDHHPPPEGALDLLRASGVKVFHEEGPCTAELAYRFFNPPSEMSRVALYGAIGDYAITTPFFKEKIRDWDIRSLFLEAGTLTLGLEAIRRDHEKKRLVVEELALNKLPSQLDFLVEAARKQARILEEARERLPEIVQSLENIAYVIDPGASLGVTAFYAAVLRGKKVGVAVEVRGNWAIMSLRARDERVDLNKALRILAPKYGGHGGGHAAAAGARIPLDDLKQFLEDLDKALRLTV